MAISELKQQIQTVKDDQYQLTMKQLTIDNEKDSLSNKVTRIDSQVMFNASKIGATKFQNFGHLAAI